MCFKFDEHKYYHPNVYVSLSTLCSWVRFYSIKTYKSSHLNV